MTPPVNGIIIHGGWHLNYATVVQFQGADVIVTDWYRSSLDGEWHENAESHIYLTCEMFDRLVEAVREQRAKEPKS